MKLDELPFVYVYVVPGSSSIIDFMHPATNRSLYSDETLSEIQLRYHGAVVVRFEEWQAEKAARQDSRVEWHEVEEEEYQRMFECLPPAYYRGDLFGAGEASDHHAVSGQPRFQAYRRVGSRYLRSSRPMTIQEMKETRDEGEM